MTKVTKLRLCDWLLLITMLLMLVSSIHLEGTGSSGLWWVWIHIIVGCCFFVNIVWHLSLHFGWKSWIHKLQKQKSPVTRWLAILALLTIISAIVAVMHWVDSYTHSSIGGVHGKIGFAFIVFAIGHTIKRINFYKFKKKNG